MGLGTKAYLVGAILTVYSSFAAALGLGEITLNSALNQPLDAEIQLLHVRDLSEREIIVGLASSEEFERAGVDRSLFFTGLEFDVDLNSAGGPVVHVTSKNPVREPFINFLLSAQWPSGKLLREYTLLVDLPVFTGERAAPVQAAPRAQDNAAVARPSAQTRRAQPSAPSTQPASSSEEYGPVGANENLWSIASKVRPDSSVTVQQTMLALQQLNPQAFINNNINLLRRGQVLRVPDKSTIQALSAREAISAVADQNRRWNQQESTADEGGAQLEGSKSFAPTRTEPTAPEGRVSLSSNTPAATGGEGTGAGEGDSGAIEGRLAVTQEELDAASRENADLKSRLSSVEEQIATMEKLVEVSSEELRSLELAAQQTNTADDAEAAPAADAEESAQPAEEAEPAEASSAPETAARTSWVDLVMANLLYIAIGLGVLAAAIGAWLYMRRRDDGFDYDFDDDLDEDYEPDYEHEALGPVGGGAAIAAAGANDEEDAYAEPAFAAEAETEDVVGESDIHIAYGQYDQAEEKLSRALEREPLNIAMRLKLLEVFAAQDDAASFDNHFAKIHMLGDSAAIDRAVMLRQSIDNAEPFDLNAQDTTEFEQALAGRYESTDTQIAGFDSEAGSEDEFNIADDTLQFDSESEPAAISTDSEWDLDESDVDMVENDDPTVIQPGGAAAAAYGMAERDESDTDTTRAKPNDESELDLDDTVVMGSASSSTDDEDLQREIESSLDAIEDSYEVLDDADEDATQSAVSVENTSYKLDDDVLADLDFDLDEIDADLTFDDVELDLEFGGFDRFNAEQDPSSIGADATNSFDLPGGDAVDVVIPQEELPLAIGAEAEENHGEPSLQDEEEQESGMNSLAYGASLDDSAEPNPNEQVAAIPEDFDYDLEREIKPILDGDDDTDIGTLTATDVPFSEDEVGELDFADYGELDIDDEQIDGGESAIFELDDEGSGPLGNNLAGAPLTGEANEDDPESIVQELTDAEEELEVGPVINDEADDLDLATDVDFDDLDKDFAALSSDFEGGLASADALMDEPLTDFEDLDLDDEHTPQPPATLDGSSSESEAGPSAQDQATSAAKSPASSIDESQFDDFEIPDFDPESDDDSDLDFLSDNDETATKLDLARAYIDMGDTDGAKDILDEIAEEGNPQQKQEAETLLSRLA